MKTMKWIHIVLLSLVMGLLMAQGVFADGEMTVSTVKVNGNGVVELGESIALKPADQATFSFTLRNNLTNKNNSVAGITAYVDIVKVEAGEGGEAIETPVASFTKTVEGSLTAQKDVSLTETLPLSLRGENSYWVYVRAEGEDLNRRQVATSNRFLFQLNIEQASADLLISKLTVADAEFTCKDSTTLRVELTNRGSNDEGDVVVTVQGGKDFSYTSSTLVLNRNTNTEISPLTVDVYATNLLVGNNELTVRANYFHNTLSLSRTITVKKNACLIGSTPAQNAVTVVDNLPQTFSVTFASGSGNVQWYVDNVLQSGQTGTSFAYTFNQAGDFVVKAVAGGESRTWNVKVVDKPLQGSLIVRPELSAGVTTVENLEIEKAGSGKIAFSQQVDLNDVANLEEVIAISGNKIAVDTTKAPEFANKPATITLFQNFTRPVILKDSGFNTEPSTRCTLVADPSAASGCKVETASSGQFKFTVSGFSTYKVVEEQTPGIEVVTGEILFANANRGERPTLTVTVKNKGTFQPLTNVRAELVSGINSKYNAALSGSLPSTLEPNGQASVTLQASIPQDEVGGKHSIGSLKIVSDQETKTYSIFIQPKSFLTITSIKVDGSSSGELQVGAVTPLEVTVENTYTEDMEDISITATVLDVEDEDLEYTSEEFELKKTKSEEKSFDLDLSRKTLDEDSYDLEIVVEGIAEDGSIHETREVKRVNVKRDNHNVILKTVSLGSSVLECSRGTSLQVTVENMGKTDEDDVEVKVSNTQLNMEERKTGLELDKFSESDTEETVNFALDFQDAAAGTYKLLVEVFRDNSLEESKEVTVTVNACSTTSGSGLSANQIAGQLQQALTDALAQPNTAAQQQATGSFRDTPQYTALLAILAALLVVTVVLSIAVLARKR